VAEGEGGCGFCGEPEPRGRTTRAWRVGPGVLMPLAPQHLNISGGSGVSLIPDVEDVESDAAEETEIEWETDDD
jgi:hypothetical protein